MKYFHIQISSVLELNFNSLMFPPRFATFYSYFLKFSVKAYIWTLLTNMWKGRVNRETRLISITSWIKLSWEWFVWEVLCKCKLNSTFSLGNLKNPILEFLSSLPNVALPHTIPHWGMQQYTPEPPLFLGLLLEEFK